MAQTVLEFRQVVKRFGTVAAVDQVSFAIQSGEIFTLLGPSGCGKTTTLRLVAGLEEPDDGEILVSGIPVATPRRNVFVAPDKRELGMVFQSYAIWPHLTVFENVAFPLRVRRESADAVRQRVHQVLESVGLAGLAERGATQLSGGQQQRVDEAGNSSATKKTQADNSLCDPRSIRSDDVVRPHRGSSPGRV